MLPFLALLQLISYHIQYHQIHVIQIFHQHHLYIHALILILPHLNILLLVEILKLPFLEGFLHIFLKSLLHQVMLPYVHHVHKHALTPYFVIHILPLYFLESLMHPYLHAMQLLFPHHFL